ncbi:MAG: glycoside hydrolase family 3 protein [Firmicutes bacterium]|nr:glycoside hydrolase family 3 protein [Candidatus Fermentithermobacillaceae bacterium]
MKISSDLGTAKKPGTDMDSSRVPAALEAKVEARLRGMSLEDKVGQVFMFGFPGKDPENARPLIENLRAGGIIYFARNTGPVGEVAALSATLQEIALRSGPGIPLFISADQEGGIVCRLTEGFPVMPGHMALAAADGPQLVEKVAEAIGTGLRVAGVNMNLAPVLDVNDNPENPVIGIRSFGSNPERVAELGAAYARGLRESGVIPVGKHFPGHGNTSVDSHLDLPVLPHSWDRLERVELFPFRRAISEGLECVMTAHVLFEAIDPDRPATLSRKVLVGLLREKLGFSGLVMTDCLEMNAISKHPGTVRGAVEAFKAGADVLLISHTFELQKEAYMALCSAVRNGEVPRSRLDESVSRILRLKYLFSIPNPLQPEDFPLDNWDEYWNLSARAHCDSITVVKDERSVVPLKPGARILLVNPDGAHRLQVEDAARSGASPGTPLGNALRSRGFVVRERTHSNCEIPEAVDEEYIIVVTQGAIRSPAQAAFLGRLRDVCLKSRIPGTVPSSQGQAIPVVLVAAREPYDVRLFPEVGTYICTYGSRPESMEALGRVLAGECVARGKLPVELK